MNWLSFAIAAWVTLGLETGLREPLRIGDFRASPSFVFILAAYVMLHAPPGAAVWACLILGVIVDLCETLTLQSGAASVVVVGPHALGFFVAAQFVFALRGLINKRNPLSYAVVGLAGSIVVSAVVVTILQVRSLYDPGVAWSATHELKGKLGSAVYTGVAAAVVSIPLLRLSGFFGFASAEKRRFMRRA